MFISYVKRWTVVQKLIFYGSCWVAYGGLYYAINRISVPIGVLEVVAFVAVFALVAHGVYVLVNWFVPTRRYAWGALALLAFYGLIWVLANTVFNWVNPLLDVPMNGGAPVGLTNPGYLKHIITIMTNFSVIALAFYHAHRSVQNLIRTQEETQRKLEETERRLQTELEKTRYEYRALAADVPPHFYANMVLSWSGQLPREYSTLADSMLKTHDLLLYHIEAHEPSKEVVPLQREIDFMLLYFELINKPGAAVFVTYELTGDTAGLTIPPTTLLAFANDAVKHGITTDPARPIRIKLSINDYVMRFSCRNWIKPVPDQPSHGVGLANVRRRLEIQYGDAFVLDTRREGDEYHVELTINYEYTD